MSDTSGTSRPPASVDALTVTEALSEYYRAHELPPDGGEGANWFHLHVGPLVLPLPNPKARKKALFYHDLNHVLTGYNTVLSDGEVLVSGYEIGSGCGRLWLAWLINLSGFALGLVVYPRGMWRSFLRGRRATSVYHSDRRSLSGMTVGDLRAQLGVPDDSRPAGLGDLLAFLFWGAVAVTLTLSPALLVIVAWRLL